MKNEDRTEESDGNLPSLSPFDESSSSAHSESDVENAAERDTHPVAETDKKSQFLENASQVIQKKWEQAQEYEEDHHILEKIREFTEDTYRNVVNWADDHQVVERSKTAAAQGTAFAVAKIQECVRPSIGAIDASTTTPTTGAKTEKV